MNKMEAYTQITLEEWTQWKEDIRRKLSETAGNFVYIGYRLKQIRDSGMFDGAADIFEFALKEYGLGKSTVSRFIAINEKYSENGNSLELKEEYKSFSSSKLSEMLTLPDNECQLITEKTTIKEIRELKAFDRQQVPENETMPDAWTPLQKCIIDFFSAEDKREALNKVLKLMSEQDPGYKEAAELVNPSGQCSHKKGIVFLFLYDWNTGVKYKKLTEPEPVSISWRQFLEDIYEIYMQTGSWEEFYKKEEKQAEKQAVENAPEAESNQGFPSSVATSQQQQKPTEKERDESGKNQEEKTEKTEIQEAAVVHDENGNLQDNMEEQVQGQMDITDFPEYMPENSENAEKTEVAPVQPEIPGHKEKDAFNSYLEALKDELDNIYKMAGYRKFDEAKKHLDKVKECIDRLEEAADGEV